MIHFFYNLKDSLHLECAKIVFSLEDSFLANFKTQFPDFLQNKSCYMLNFG